MAIEHTLMTSGAGIESGISQGGYRTSVRTDYKGTYKFYETETDLGGTNNSATYVQVPYSSGSVPDFTYNDSDHLYYRNQFGVPHIDGATGEQVKFTNVVVLFADYTDLHHANGYLACDLTGDGYGFLITAGKYKIIRWHKDTRDSELRLLNLDNTDTKLNPGKSFFCITSTAYNKSVGIS
ncbi:hypothetical protein FACS1894105_13410 [Clostridia bacterium]|nr:hypothetical protein FACS1894105_13410 [Clostridia bacterium]